MGFCWASKPGGKSLGRERWALQDVFQTPSSRLPFTGTEHGPTLVSSSFLWELFFGAERGGFAEGGTKRRRPITSQIPVFENPLFKLFWLRLQQEHAQCMSKTDALPLVGVQWHREGAPHPAPPCTWSQTRPAWPSVAALDSWGEQPLLSLWHSHPAVCCCLC